MLFDGLFIFVVSILHGLFTLFFLFEDYLAVFEGQSKSLADVGSKLGWEVDVWILTTVSLTHTIHLHTPLKHHSSSYSEVFINFLV